MNLSGIGAEYDKHTAIMVIVCFLIVCLGAVEAKKKIDAHIKKSNIHLTNALAEAEEDARVAWVRYEQAIRITNSTLKELLKANQKIVDLELKEKKE